MAWMDQLIAIVVNQSGKLRETTAGPVPGFARREPM